MKNKIKNGPKNIYEVYRLIINGYYDNCLRSSIPVFGKNNVYNTIDIWSWDETHQIKGTDKNNVIIEKRNDIKTIALSEYIKENISKYKNEYYFKKTDFILNVIENFPNIARSEIEDRIIDYFSKSKFDNNITFDYEDKINMKYDSHDNCIDSEIER